MGRDESEPLLLPGAEDTGDVLDVGLGSELAATSSESFLVFMTERDGKGPAGEARAGTDGFGREVIIVLGLDVAAIE